MSIRSAQELADVPDPAWPTMRRVLGRRDVVVLAPPPDSADVLYRLQVTARSALGALALNCGGIVVDDGWLRILGGGYPGLPDLATANGFGDPADGVPTPDRIDVAYDVLGGVFAVNMGGLLGDLGDVNYFAPETLEWIPLGFGQAAFIEWSASGALFAFYDPVRWPGWSKDIENLGLDEGLSVYPPLWTPEGRDPKVVTRTKAVLSDLVAWNLEYALPLDRGQPESCS